MTAELALRFGRAFAQSPQFWLNLQATYDLKTAELRIGTRLGAVRRLGGLPRMPPRRIKEKIDAAMNACLAGDTAIGRAVLRGLVDATIGFEDLAAELKKPTKSVHRMLAPSGNPSVENFFGIVNALQRNNRVKLHVTAAATGGRHLKAV